MINIVLGTFFGDEGKGQCVNNLCDADTLVVRFSGANQVGHNVSHDGLTHCFRNFGSGTFKGAITYWSECCVCDLHTLWIELGELRQLGIVPKIVFSPLCELVTPFDVIHQWNNQANRSHGTVGTGFKPTLDRVAKGYSVTIADARNLTVLKEKVFNIAQYYYQFDTEAVIPDLREWISSVNQIANKFPVFNLDYLNNFGNIVFEGSQGILLDQKHGVMPFCTPSYTTSRNAFEIISKLNRTDELKVNYVCRPYITRHGNGPLLTTTSVIEVEDSNNPWNDFQKHFRACEFDVDLLRHSLEIDSIYHPHMPVDKYVCFSHGSELSPELESRISEHFQIRKFEFENWL